MDILDAETDMAVRCEPDNSGLEGLQEQQEELEVWIVTSAVIVSFPPLQILTHSVNNLLLRQGLLFQNCDDSKLCIL